MNNGRTRGRHGTLVGRVQLRVSITCLGGHCASDLPACAASYEAEPTHAPRVRYKSRAEKDEVRISPRYSLRSCSRSLVCPSLSLYPPNRSLDTHHSLLEKMIRATVATVLAFSTLASAFSGDGTFYAAGLGACGITNSDTDMIAAISSTYFDAYPYVVFLVSPHAVHAHTSFSGATGNPNSNPICGKQIRATCQSSLNSEHR